MPDCGIFGVAPCPNHALNYAGMRGNLRVRVSPCTDSIPSQKCAHAERLHPDFGSIPAVSLPLPNTMITDSRWMILTASSPFEVAAFPADPQFHVSLHFVVCDSVHHSAGHLVGDLVRLIVFHLLRGNAIAMFEFSRVAGHS